jgi:beta-glucosidase
VIRYTEAREVGYRWFQAQGITPLFAFGFGLSYTTFELTDVAVSGTDNHGTQPIEISLTVTNTGSVAGAEEPQVYLGVPREDQPPKRLVGFTKVFLEPGASQRVTIIVDPAATSHLCRSGTPA